MNASVCCPSSTGSNFFEHWLFPSPHSNVISLSPAGLLEQDSRSFALLGSDIVASPRSAESRVLAVKDENVQPRDPRPSKKTWTLRTVRSTWPPSGQQCGWMWIWQPDGEWPILRPTIQGHQCGNDPRWLPPDWPALIKWIFQDVPKWSLSVPCGQNLTGDTG